MSCGLVKGKLYENQGKKKGKIFHMYIVYFRIHFLLDCEKGRIFFSWLKKKLEASVPIEYSKMNE